MTSRPRANRPQRDRSPSVFAWPQVQPNWMESEFTMHCEFARKPVGNADKKKFARLVLPEACQSHPISPVHSGFNSPETAHTQIEHVHRTCGGDFRSHRFFTNSYLAVQNTTLILIYSPIELWTNRGRLVIQHGQTWPPNFLQSCFPGYPQTYDIYSSFLEKNRIDGSGKNPKHPCGRWPGCGNLQSCSSGFRHGLGLDSAGA